MQLPYNGYNKSHHGGSNGGLHSTIKSTGLGSGGSRRNSGEGGSEGGSMDDARELRGGGGLLGGASPNMAYPAFSTPASTSSLSSYAILAIVDNIVCAFHNDTCELGIYSLC